jgi:Restriction endonuclease
MVARPTAFYPQPEITPGEFEDFVACQLLGAAAPEVNNLTVALHDKIMGADGTYDFDATVRYQFAGMSFLVVVEAKLHKNPIKRELVQVLQQKAQSVGAHKGVMISTAPYQAGAVAFARAHGIALATVTEGRFVFRTRDAVPTTFLSREKDGARFAPPSFVAHYYAFGERPGAMRACLMSPDDDEYPCHIAKFLLGHPSGY